MQIYSSSLTSGVAEKTLAQAKHVERQTSTQKQRDNLQEKTSSSNRRSSKVIIGGGGDHAIIGQSGTSRKQRDMIDSINRPHVSEETKALVADFESSAEEIRQQEAALDAELAQNMKNLVQVLKSTGSVNKNEKSADDSEEITEKTALKDQGILTPEEELRQRHMEQAAANAAQKPAPESKSGRQEEQAKSIAKTKEPEYPAPTMDSDGHIEGYM